MSRCCDVGSYECQQLVIYNNERNRIISVDKCLIPEIQSLWLRGITTIGCCCGHGNGGEYIQVDQFDSDDMCKLGYKQLDPQIGDDGFLYGLDCFKPKTCLPVKELP